ncbi:response regulator transcription factor [Paenibacillus sp. J2TS4]|uniref:response regulator transcription factor n=1 Tax=Paenibacillus sp. J2TS4 TaxID=2807194 RepID=UPI001B10B279|nr:response regulator transcription factor [Paenibacillus sp. J2TS4]GIP31051.1 DNA-binding response regulator [Paenibacillus sp. J2TS4]
MNIFIVEDEPKIRNVLKAYLEKEGWKVDYTADGHEAVRRFDQEQYDLILLDLKLAGLSGEEVCAKIREKSNVPIIMITSKNRENDTIRGLNLGADDYIAKPFRVKEVVARIQALKRRLKPSIAENKQSHIFSYDHRRLIINTSSRWVQVEGKLVSLTATEYKLLSVLMENETKIFNRSELSYLVQGYRFEGDSRTIDAHVKNLRKKLEPEGQPPRYILTRIGRGYQFCAVLDEE